MDPVLFININKVTQSKWNRENDNLGDWSTYVRALKMLSHLGSLQAIKECPSDISKCKII